jgi:hypothetical protein
MGLSMIIYFHHISGIINDYLPSPVFCWVSIPPTRFVWYIYVYFPLTFSRWLKPPTSFLYQIHHDSSRISSHLRRPGLLADQLQVQVAMEKPMGFLVQKKVEKLQSYVGLTMV